MEKEKYSDQEKCRFLQEARDYINNQKKKRDLFEKYMHNSANVGDLQKKVFDEANAQQLKPDIHGEMNPDTESITVKKHANPIIFEQYLEHEKAHAEEVHELKVGYRRQNILGRSYKIYKYRSKQTKLYAEAEIRAYNRGIKYLENETRRLATICSTRTK